MTALGTVLVTGGAGFIGCALAQRFGETADRWVAVDSLHPQVHAEQRRPDELPEVAELVVGDVALAETWDAVLADVRPDLVIHLAAETGTAQSLSEATRHATANVVGTTAMTDAFTRHSVLPGHIILSSSRAVYGEGRWQRADGSLVDPGQRVHEQLEAAQWDFPGATPVPSEYGVTPPAPTSVYGATKLTQELLLGAWTGAFGVPLTVLRLQNVYGDGQSLINPYTGIVSLFSQLARDGKSIPVYEDGAIVRDFVYIADVAAAFEAASRDPQPGVRGFDVGFGVGTTILGLAEAIAEYHDAPAPHITGAYREGDVRAASCRIERTVEGLGWTPEWNLERGVSALQDWIESRR